MEVINLKTRKRTTPAKGPMLPWEMPITPGMYEFFANERNHKVVSLVSLIYKKTFMIGYQVVEMTSYYVMDTLSMTAWDYATVMQICMDEHYLTARTSDKAMFNLENAKNPSMYQHVVFKFALNKERFLGDNYHRILVDYRKLKLGLDPTKDYPLHELYPELGKPSESERGDEYFL